MNLNVNQIKDLFMLITLLCLNKFELSSKAPIFKISDRVRITYYKNFFSKSYTKKWSKETFVTDSLLKTNPWTHKIKDLNGKEISGSFYEKAAVEQIINELISRTI